MSVGFAALIAAVSVIYWLAATPGVQDGGNILTLLGSLLNGRQLTTELATTALLYTVVIYTLVFSVSLFVLRLISLFLAALGIPDEQQIRRNREQRRAARIQSELNKQQARLIAQYLIRAQQAATRRGGTGPLGRVGTGPLPPLDIGSKK